MRARTRRNILIAAGYSAVLAAGLMLGPDLVRENQNSKNGSIISFNPGGHSSKVEQVIQIINENYVDSVKLDTVQNLAIQEILKQLDPHSAYLSPEDAQLLSDDLKGNFNGIGIEYYILNDTLLITSVNQGGPAFKAGIQHGDKILAINKKSVAGNHTNAKRVIEQIRGKRGSSVELLVKRDSIRKYFQIKRDRIQVSSVDAAYLIADQQGYIKISKFGAQTDEDFHQSLMKLKKQGMKNLILDLRDNGGGYLSSATALADEFLKDQELIVYTEGLHEPRTDYYASPKGEFEQGKLVVLIDENTASASEIIAGAVQDLERGTIIGRRSFGKGLVQEQFDFGDGSALNLTIARYYTASGRSIQKSYKKGSDAYFNEINDRYKSGEMNSEAKGISDSIYKKSKTYTTRSGKVLYGGGGIMPDIYIPVDTNNKEFLFTLSGKGVLNDMLYNYLVKTDRKYHNAEELIKGFSLNARDIGMLRKLASSKKIRMKDNQLEHSLPLVKMQLKALMARYYFGDEGFYKALNSEDRAVNRSLELFRAL